jgi:hypothetical protein
MDSENRLRRTTRTDTDAKGKSSHRRNAFRLIDKRGLVKSTTGARASCARASRVENLVTSVCPAGPSAGFVPDMRLT